MGYKIAGRWPKHLARFTLPLPCLNRQPEARVNPRHVLLPLLLLLLLFLLLLLLLLLYPLLHSRRPVALVLYSIFDFFQSYSRNQTLTFYI